MLRGAAESEEWTRIASLAERSVELRSAMRCGLGACGRTELSGGWQPTRLTIGDPRVKGTLAQHPRFAAKATRLFSRVAFLLVGNGR